MKIGIFPNIHKKGTLKIIQELFSLEDRSIDFFIDMDVEAEIKGNYKYGNLSEADVVLSLGGDGTLIKVMRKCAPFNVPVLGIHLGHLGFLVEVQKDRVKEAIQKLKNNDFLIEERMMLHAQIVKDKKIIANHIGLNDVVLTRKSTSRMICAGVVVNGLLIDNYYADGVIVSTPTGSTGYSLSAGGPIVDPTLNMMVVTPICPHSLHSRTIVINDSKEIILEPDLDYNSDTIITIDGQVSMDITEGMMIRVTKSNVMAKFIKLSEYNFYELLRTKLFERGNN